MVWKKGQSGNPKGSPKKGTTITDYAEKYLHKKSDAKIGGKKVKATNKEIFVKKVYQLALQGNLKAIELIWNYIDGKPKQYITQEIVDDFYNEGLSKKAQDIIDKRAQKKAHLLLLKQKKKEGGKK